VKLPTFRGGEILVSAEKLKEELLLSLSESLCLGQKLKGQEND
jgi:hypothetical protein